MYTFSLDFPVAAITKFHVKILKHCSLHLIWGQLIQSNYACKGAGNFIKIGLWLIPKNVCFQMPPQRLVFSPIQISRIGHCKRLPIHWSRVGFPKSCIWDIFSSLCPPQTWVKPHLNPSTRILTLLFGSIGQGFS